MKIQRMWNMTCMNIPVITEATGIVINGLKNTLEAMPVTHSVSWLEERAALETTHKIREVLQCETGSLSGGDHSWFKRISTVRKRLWQETWWRWRWRWWRRRRWWYIDPFRSRRPSILVFISTKIQKKDILGRGHTKEDISLSLVELEKHFSRSCYDAEGQVSILPYRNRLSANYKS
jgi:hypothetical protein